MSIWNLFRCGAAYDEIFDELENDSSSAKNAGVWDMLGCGSDFDELLDEIGAQPSEDSQLWLNGKREASGDNGRAPLDAPIQAVQPGLSNSGRGDAELLDSKLNSGSLHEMEVESSENSESQLVYSAPMPPAVQQLIDLNTAEAFLLAVTKMIVKDPMHLQLLREPLSNLLLSLASEKDWASIDFLADKRKRMVWS